MVLTVLVGGGPLVPMAAHAEPATTAHEGGAEPTSTPDDDLRRTPVVRAVERAAPAVVTIEVEVAQASLFGSSVTASHGSGVIIHGDGLVLTNAHVVSGAQSIRATTQQGVHYEAVVLAMHRDLDLAVLQLEEASDLPTIELGDSSELFLGETAVAIGNPLGLGMTVSTGVVSSVQREVELQRGVTQTFIQTDAAINPGNSGGALIDIHGRLIGVNTAIRADAEGIGFAIPVNRARKIAEDLVHYGTVRAPWLGCDVVDIDTRRLWGTALADGAVRVTRVWADGPAATAGVKPGDLLFEVQGARVKSRADLNARLASLEPGATVEARWFRDGVLQRGVLHSSDIPDDTVETSLERIIGIQLQEARDSLLVTAARPDGSWVANQLRAGDRVLSIDGRRVRRVEEVAEAIRRARAQHRATVLFFVARGRNTGHMAVEI